MDRYGSLWYIPCVDDDPIFSRSNIYEKAPAAGAIFFGSHEAPTIWAFSRAFGNPGTCPNAVALNVSMHGASSTRRCELQALWNGGAIRGHRGTGLISDLGTIMKNGVNIQKTIENGHRNSGFTH